MCNISVHVCACVITFVSATDSVNVSTRVRMMLRKGTHVQKTSQCLLVSLISWLFLYSWEESLGPGLNSGEQYMCINDLLTLTPK